jgi:hypothetical protein
MPYVRHAGLNVPLAARGRLRNIYLPIMDLVVWGFSLELALLSAQHVIPANDRLMPEQRSDLSTLQAPAWLGDNLSLIPYVVSMVTWLFCVGKI